MVLNSYILQQYCTFINKNVWPVKPQIAMVHAGTCCTIKLMPHYETPRQLRMLATSHNVWAQTRENAIHLKVMQFHLTR